MPSSGRIDSDSDPKISIKLSDYPMLLAHRAAAQVSRKGYGNCALFKAARL